jgi:large subunit ribosomal protein L5e
MGFVKKIKTTAYFSRYQVKFRRRREGKTDFHARRRLIQQDKNKYETKKYRFVVRRTNKKVVCQIIYATIQGDRVLCQADSAELKKFGVEAGWTNYAAAYCAGLLCARRLLTELGMADMYKGIEAADGEFFDVYEKDGALNENRKPFKAYLDVGLVRTTTGNRVFGAMKGAVDGGIHIPHNTKRFPGYHIEKAQVQTGKRGKVVEKGKATTSYNAKEHREHIFGIHVQNYMDHLKKTAKEKYNKQFSKWDATLTKAKVANLEALYKKVHSEIRKNAKRVKVERKQAAVRKQIKKEKGENIMQDSKGRKWIRRFKLTKAQRKERVAAKIQKALAKK